MKLLGEVLTLAVKYLKEKDISSPRLTAETLLSHVLGKKRIELYMYFDTPLQEVELESFRSFLRRAVSLEPVEYITSQVEFYNCLFQVSKEVLIPRPETEILVDKAVEILKKEDLNGKVVLDLCSGSGCIGLSLKKKFPLLEVYLSDLSPSAMDVCRTNAEKNDLKVSFLVGDFLIPFQGMKADYVFCNPPYVASLDYENLDLSVKGYEPKLALVGGESGLIFYERLAKELLLYLNPCGKVFLEIGSGQGNALKEIFSGSSWKKKELLYDFAGHDRFFFLEIE